MNKTKVFKPCIFFILLLSLMTAAFAVDLQTIGTSVEAPTCGIHSEKVLITNVDVPGKYDISFADTDTHEWATIEPSQVFSAPGQVGEFTIFVNVPCLQEDKTIDYTLLVTENDAQVYEFGRTLTAKNYANVKVEVLADTLRSCPCEPQQIPYRIENTGLYPETYDITVKGAGEEVLIESSVFLGPQQTHYGLAHVQYPCDQYGQKEFTLEYTATTSGYVATVPIDYQIDACYEYTLSAPQEVVVCEQDTKVVDITLTNDAKYDNAYDLDFEGPKFSGISGDLISLNVNQHGIANIVLEPNYGDRGTYTLEVDTESHIGELEKEQEISVTVLQCYNPQIYTSQDTYQICPQENTIGVKVTNSGLFEETIYLAHTGPNSVSFLNDYVQLLPNQSQTIQMVIDPRINETTEYNYLVYAYLSNHTQIQDIAHIELQPQDASTCYDVRIKSANIYVNNSYQEHTLDVTHKGIIEKEFSFSLVSNESWMMLTEATKNLTPGATATLTLITNATAAVANQSYPIFVQAQTDVSIQHVPVFVSVNKESNMLLWIVIILIILLILLLVLLLILLARNKPTQQPITKPVKQGKEAKSTKKQTAKQTKKQQPKPVEKVETKESSFWRIILFIILILFVLFVLGLFIWLIYFALTGLAGGAGLANMTDGTNITNTTALNGTAVIGNTVLNTTQLNQTNTTQLNQTNTTQLNQTNTTQLNKTNTTNATDSSNSFWGWLTSLFKQKESNEPTSNTMNTTNITVVTNQTITQNTSIISNATNESNTTLVQTPSKRDISINNTLNAYNARNTSSTSLAYIRIVENTTTQIDLKENFIDPDGDNLTFSYVPINKSNISIWFNGTVMYIEPKEHFIGIQTFKVRATDPDGLTVDSPIVELFVLPIDDSKQSYLSYAVAILILLLIITAIIWIDIKLLQKKLK
ncbi:MAG: outer membrane biosynthesis protein TonB [Candidatus Woesearchaeota archaeon]|jgi:outer membrane biosynthesis protein TonB